MKSTKPHWIAISFLSIALISVISISFLGTTKKLDDGRIAIYLNQDERNMALGEMRKLLEVSQKIVQALVENDLKTIEKEAESVGTNAITTVDMKLAPKLPKDFRALGFGLHGDFSSLAKMAKDGKNSKEIQMKLADSMNKCVACHSTYQLPAPVQKNN
jgi:hypothetical protein